MITVIGGGFAGVEAAWSAARLGVPVRLVEMRPRTMTPAHKTGLLAELVCSNSFKSALPTSPAGQLKAEMTALGSLVLEVAQRHSVPGGEALCVDRDRFANEITDRVESHRGIELLREEADPDSVERMLEEGPVVLATGPLTSPALSEWLARKTGRRHLYFYDAVSPTVEAASLDTDVVFAASRYGKGGGDDYLNCPFDRESYLAFVRELVRAGRAPIHAFEAGGLRTIPPPSTLSASPLEGESGEGREPGGGSASPLEGEAGDPGPPGEPGGGSLEDAFLEKVKYFSGCTPIEAIAEKGEMSLAFGNFKPVGLADPRTGRRPFAVLQLRPENRERTLYSLVGCQTRLKWGEQKRVFRMVPGLGRAEFARYGVIHRNTYLDAPRVLASDLRLREQSRLYVAGQLTGVEGYVESAAIGILVGLNAARSLLGLPAAEPPRETAYGSLLAHLRDDTEREFAPMNINWGLFPKPAAEVRDKGERRAAQLDAARAALSLWLSDLAIPASAR